MDNPIESSGGSGPGGTSRPESPAPDLDSILDPVPNALPGPPQPAAEPGKNARKDSVFEVSVVVLAALLLALILKVYVAEAYQIRGPSMRPTFEDGERVMVQKILYTIKRRDIIIFSSKDDPSKDLIKRVIGLPGDVIRIEDGEVFVNGEKLNEEEYGPLVDTFHHESHGPTRVPEDTYFVLGDNRPQSLDSREFKTIDHSLIKGKVFLRWWPFQKTRSY